MKGQNKIYLASGSPRRRELLRFVFEDFLILVPDFNESLQGGEKPLDYVSRMSEGKARAFVAEFRDLLNDGDIFIAADTIVCQGDEIFGKPQSHSEAFSVLRKLQGCKHVVMTSVTIGTVKGDLICFESFYSETKVYFRCLSESEILSYLETDEPWDKAGSYGIQGKASIFVKKIEGSYHNVMGLPVAEIAAWNQKIRKF